MAIHLRNSGHDYKENRRTRHSLLFIVSVALASLLIIFRFTPILDYYEFIKPMKGTVVVSNGTKSDGKVVDERESSKALLSSSSSSSSSSFSPASVLSYFRGSNHNQPTPEQILRRSKELCGAPSSSSSSSQPIALFNMKTKMGVTYDGGHWFHMAENFLVQHSILRAKDGLSKSISVIFNFDDASFVDDLNGITSLFVLLGSIDDKVTSTLQHVYFTSIPELNSLDSSEVHLPVDISLSQSMFVGKKVKVVDVRPSVETKDRFVGASVVMVSDPSQLPLFSNLNKNKSSKSTSSSSVNPSICAAFLGSIGGVWPTPQRGHWFPHTGDVASLRSKFAELCPTSPSSSRTLMDHGYFHDHQHSSKETDNNNDNNNNNRSLTSTQQPSTLTVRKLVIYQRDLNRKLLNQEETIKNLQTALAKMNSNLPASSKVEWTIQVVMHASDRSPCELYSILQFTDVLITPHGFQSMLLLFMRPHTIIFEVFPYKYFKRAYGPLGREFGIVHGGVMTPPVTRLSSIILRTVSTDYCMNSKQCRNYARNHDVELTVRGVNVLTNLISHHDFVRDAVKVVSRPSDIKVKDKSNSNSNSNSKGIDSSVVAEVLHQDQSICISSCKMEGHEHIYGYLDPSVCLNVCSIMKSVPY